MPTFNFNKPIAEDPNAKVLFFKSEHSESIKDAKYSDCKKV